MAKVYTIIMVCIYGIALLTCFIVDMAINKTLTWFYIVLISILISFTITNLPVLLKKQRVLLSALVFTGLLYLLLYVIAHYVNGSWLLSFAYPVTTYSMIFFWLMILTINFLKLNWGFKIAIVSMLIGAFTITSNPVIHYFSGDSYSMSSSFVYDGSPVDYTANGFIFYGFVGCTLISFIVGVCLAVRARTGK